MNLAWQSTRAEREKSLNLDMGYCQNTDTWDVIIRYSGDILLFLADFIEQGLHVVILTNQYAVIRASKEMLEQILVLPQIIYMEKPKRMYEI